MRKHYNLPRDRELKRCPFCGGKAGMFWDNNPQGVETYYVFCRVCPATLGWGPNTAAEDVNPDHYFESESEAIEAWNSRPLEGSKK